MKIELRAFLTGFIGTLLPLALVILPAGNSAGLAPASRSIGQ